jgi:hypothetical protein
VTFIQPTNPGFYVSGGTIQYTPNILAYDAKNCYAAY